MQKDSILVVGSSNYDMILKQIQFPQTGETILADSLDVCGGGKGANQAVQCAKLGIKTHFLGSIGDDGNGNYLHNELKKYNVLVDNLKISSLPTGVGIVNCLHNGEVRATVFPGANNDILPSDLELHEELFKNAKILILQLEIPLDSVYKAIELGEKHNCFIILNGAPAKELSLFYLSKVDCFVLNETEASFYLKDNFIDKAEFIENGLKLLSLVKKMCIVTLGKDGSIIITDERIDYIEPNVVNAIETTGAGDSYIGAFASQLFKGKDFKECCEFATKASSYTVQHIGAQSSMPTMNDIERMS